MTISNADGNLEFDRLSVETPYTACMIPSFNEQCTTRDFFSDRIRRTAEDAMLTPAPRRRPSQPASPARPPTRLATRRARRPSGCTWRPRRVRHALLCVTSLAPGGNRLIAGSAPSGAAADVCRPAPRGARLGGTRAFRPAQHPPWAAAAGRCAGAAGGDAGGGGARVPPGGDGGGPRRADRARGGRRVVMRCFVWHIRILDAVCPPVCFSREREVLEYKFWCSTSKLWYYM